MSRYDLVGPFVGACGLCDGPDARHRVYGAIRERHAGGESPEDLAFDYDLCLESIRLIIEDRAG